MLPTIEFLLLTSAMLFLFFAEALTIMGYNQPCTCRAK